jgi:glycosyltransferase 2 family protein
LTAPAVTPGAPTSARAARERAAFSRTARLAVAGGLTAYILWKSHPRDVVAAAAAADWRLIAVAVLLVFVDRALMAYRWIVLLYTLDPADRPPLKAILRIFFVSTFLGTFLPSVGGDAVRAYGIAKLNIRGGDAVASVFMDRMLGIASLLIMAVAGVLLARDLASNGVIIASLGVAAAACLTTLFIVFSQRADALASAIVTRLPVAVQAGAYQLLASIQRYAAHHAQLVKVLVCSVAVQALRILQAYYLGRGLGIEASLGTYFAFLPLILLVMLLPVTVSGLGTGQAAFIWFFARAGVSAAAAFALSVLFIGLGIVGNLPGGILYAWGTKK